MTESEVIDEILNALNEDRETTVKSELAYGQGYVKAISYKLIESRSKFNFKFITERGYEVIKAGGFEAWMEFNKRRESEIHQAALDTANATIDAAVSAKHSKYAAWTSIAIALLVSGFSVYQWWDLKQSQNIFNATTSKFVAQDSLLKIQLQNLQAKVDSLKIRSKK
jgi:hypothetical protein